MGAIGPFKLAINMPGAVSAGAYTAGVLDFLIEAMDAWEAAKAAGATVPRHQVSIEVLTGASAGGMCAAISAVQLQENFPHIAEAAAPGAITGNRLYDSWVQRVNILRLLETRDLKANPQLVSGLDCTVLNEIAADALMPPQSNAGRGYISPSLTLMLTLTNLRGTYYPLYSNAAKTAGEFATYFGDRIRFQYGSAVTAADGAPVEPLPADGQGSWPVLGQAALATGAFPLALAPRVLTRKACLYEDKSWSEEGSCCPVPPDFAGLVPADGTLDTLNVDGGVTDNDPFALAHDYIANLAPQSAGGQNPREADTADRAVLSIAPFPSTETFSKNFSGPTSLPSIAGRVLNALIAQSRFQGESLGLLTTRQGFSRFVIAPTDEKNPGGAALQGSALSAFGGFFSKGFRDHDFLLGRRNCQKFLTSYLVFRSDNPVIAAGLEGLSPQQVAAMAVRPPFAGDPLPAGVCWIPLVPLCGAAQAEVPYPQPYVMPYSDLEAIGNAVHSRVKACVNALINQSLKGFEAEILKIVDSAGMIFISGSKIAGWLAEALGNAVSKPE
ncbi:MAG: hypothetical protein WCE75_08760 [Terracidiphilus sp.]